MRLDSYIFGNMQAGKVIVEYLNNLSDPKFCSKISAMINGYNRNLNKVIQSDLQTNLKRKLINFLLDEKQAQVEVTLMRSPRLAGFIMNLLVANRNNAFKTIRNSEELPTKIMP